MKKKHGGERRKVADLKWKEDKNGGNGEVNRMTERKDESEMET